MDRVLKGLLEAGNDSIVRVGSVKAMDPLISPYNGTHWAGLPDTLRLS